MARLRSIIYYLAAICTCLCIRLLNNYLTLVGPGSNGRRWLSDRSSYRGWLWKLPNH